MTGRHFFVLLVTAVACCVVGAQRGMADGAGGAAASSPRIAGEEAFTVRPRLDDLYFYPCADCHEYMDSNDDIRELEVTEGHPAVLEHGAGRIWCLSCHAGPDYNTLQNLLHQPLDYDHGYRVCAGCHSEQYRDWSYGAHGKRVANWRGDRVIYSCVECHNPHSPAIAPRAPQPPPPVRAGLQPMNGDRPETMLQELHPEGGEGE